MQDQPPASAIVDLTVAHLRDNLLPALEGRAQFEMRVALNALAVVRRTLQLAADSDAAELERLTALLGESGDLEKLNRRLCALIRDGSISFDSPGLEPHLRATAMEKLAVDQPTYSAYRQALEA